MWLIKRAALLGGLSSLALLSACGTPRPMVEGSVPKAPTPIDQYEIGLSETPDQVGLTVHAAGVSAPQREALAAFAMRWRNAGSGWITVQAPNDSADPSTARAYAQAAISTLGTLGVPYDRVRIIGYAAGSGAKPVVLASFTHTVAVAPDCHDVPWENLTATKDNQPMHRFGCVITANLAAQIADPNDLRGDIPLAPADNVRRMNVLEKYRDGKVTSSEKDDQASGAVSNTVKP